MTINNYKEILNIASILWMGKGITQVEFKEQLVVEKDIDTELVQLKYNSSPIGTTLTHSCIGYQLNLLYHKNIIHGCYTVELIEAKRIQEYLDGSITEYQLIGIENICNLYQTFVQTLLVAGVELKINHYANTVERDRNILGKLDILHQDGLNRKEIGSHSEVTTDNTNFS